MAPFVACAWSDSLRKVRHSGVNVFAKFIPDITLGFTSDIFSISEDFEVIVPSFVKIEVIL